MSLNRYESMLLGYLENHPEEMRFWEGRVREVANRKITRVQAALDLNQMFWDYFDERSRFQSPFREVATHENMEKISMLNLSEYLLRMWAPPPEKPRKQS